MTLVPAALSVSNRLSATLTAGPSGGTVACASGYCGAQVGSCLPLRDAEKPSLAIVLTVGGIGLG